MKCWFLPPSSEGMQSAAKRSGIRQNSDKPTPIDEAARLPTALDSGEFSCDATDPDVSHRGLPK